MIQSNSYEKKEEETHKKLSVENQPNSGKQIDSFSESKI